MSDEKKTFNKRCYGLIIIKSENSNFNADFTGSPRRLPDAKSTVYATDKALKYAIRKYWVDNKKNVFVWKTFKTEKEGYIPLTLEERFKTMKELLKVNAPLDIFSQCIDTKLFGITFAMKSKDSDNKNMALSGPVQITYGVNKYPENIIFSNDILSPYASEAGDKNSTIGNENKGKEFYYVYDFVINPQNILNHYENNPEIQEKMAVTEGDINDLKEAFKYAVTNLNTASKIGSENFLTLFITLGENSKAQIPILKNMVTIAKKDDKTIINLEEVAKILDQYQPEAVELYCNDTLHTVSYPTDKNWKKANL